MRLTLMILAVCIIAAVLMTGCEGIGGGIGEKGTSGLVGDGSASGSGSGSGISGIASRQPEPATVALLGAGLVAFALLRRRKK